MLSDKTGITVKGTQDARELGKLLALTSLISIFIPVIPSGPSVGDLVFRG